MNAQTTAQTTAETTADPFARSLPNDPPPSSPTIEAAERLREVASDKVRRLRDAAEAGFQNYRKTAEPASDPRSKESLEDLRLKLKDLHRDAEAWARENPTGAMLAAAGAGFVLGLLLKR